MLNYRGSVSEYLSGYGNSSIGVNVRRRCDTFSSSVLLECSVWISWFMQLQVEKRKYKHN